MFVLDNTHAVVFNENVHGYRKFYKEHILNKTYWVLLT